MRYRPWIGPALVLVFATASAAAQSSGDSKYPEWKGQWVRIGAGTYDPDKRSGGQPPPLTAEYEAIWEANRAEEVAGGRYYNPQSRCLPAGMPRMMVAFEPMEVIVTPAVTYIQASYFNEFRRIYTDGRDWPKELERAFVGYSIGKWEDTDGDGRYDTLMVETRGMKGPRVFDASGIPVHEDNETVVKERIALDKSNANVLIDEITTIDHALNSSLDDHAEIPACAHRELGRIRVHRRQPICLYRQGNLHHERGWLPDAYQEGPAAARPALLQPAAELAEGSVASGLEIFRKHEVEERNACLCRVACDHPYQHKGARDSLKRVTTSPIGSQNI